MELFSEFEGEKHHVGLEAEVGISIKGEKNQSVKDLWAFFLGSDAHFMIFFECLDWIFFLRFVEEVRTRPLLHSISYLLPYALILE